MRGMPGAPLAHTLVPLSDLGIETRLGAREGEGWVAAGRLVNDGDELRAALAQIAAELGTDREDVCASQLIETWTALVAAVAAAGLVAGARLPDVSAGNLLLRPQGGLAEWRVGLRRPRFHALPGDPDARHPDALPASDERELLHRLGAMLVNAHLAPLVGTLNRLGRRPERALWRGAADRVAGAFLWIGEQLGARERSRALVRGVAESAPELRAKVRIQRVAGGAEETHVHLRHGCCIYYRVPGAPKCIGCPLVTDAERIRRVAAE
jgi:hypothetical protein